jgi:WS/DGAT/MGAT family acyltransferase
VANYAYDRLTALDYAFLAFEKPNAYMHVASTQIYEVGPLRREDGGVDANAIAELTAASLHRIPRYRQKLAYIPIENHPVWVDDHEFNIDYHLRHTSLPRPGTTEQLQRLSARIMQQHLDRSRPLWEMWIVEGLEGDRWALVSKVHHCMIDGLSGVDLMKILMSPTPQRQIPEAPAFIPRPAPTGLALLRDELRRRAALPLDAFRDVRNFVREANDVRREVEIRGRAVAEMLGSTFRRASQTPLNHEIGPHRRFDWLSMELADIKGLRKALGGSINDVVLTIVTGAVRRFLERRHVNPADVDFRVMAPVSVRSDDDEGVLGNRISAWIVDLPIAEPDPRKQLERIGQRTRELKESKHAMGADLLTQAAEWSSSTLLALGARNAIRLMPFNMVVTNVPGPQIPLYTLGAKMLEVYPHVPLTDNLGLGVALLSYNGKLCWGFNADYDLLPDLDAFLAAVEDSFAEMRELASAALRSELHAARAADATSAGTPPSEPAPPADYRVALEPHSRRVRVMWNGETIADSERALRVLETNHDPVIYFPRDDVRMDLMSRTAHHTFCPFKGDASYFSIEVGGRTTENAVWSYEQPLEAVAELEDYVAFYRDRVDAWIEEDGAS